MMNALGAICGIDPGKAGGIAILSRDGIVVTFEMPKTEPEVASLFEGRVANAGISFCLIERVHSMPGAGVAGMFTFGRGVGVLVGLLMAHKIPFEEIEPRAWQKYLLIPARTKKPRKPKAGVYYPPEESKPEFKRRLMAKAQMLFPGVQVSMKTADALLIAEAGRRIRFGFEGRSVFAAMGRG